MHDPVTISHSKMSSTPGFKWLLLRRQLSNLYFLHKAARWIFPNYRFIHSTLARKPFKSLAFIPGFLLTCRASVLLSTMQTLLILQTPVYILLQSPPSRISVVLLSKISLLFIFCLSLLTTVSCVSLVIQLTNLHKPHIINAFSKYPQELSTILKK